MDKKCNWIVGLYTLIFGLTFGLRNPNIVQ